MQTTGKKVIALDFDDVVAHFNAHFVVFHNKRYGTDLAYENLYLYDNWELMYGCDRETMALRAHEFYNSREHQEIKPVPGALEAITHLSQNYSLQIVTSRPEHIRDVTLNWINEFFPVHFEKIHFTNGFMGAAGSIIKKKSEVCREIGATVIIDDAIKHVKDVAASGLPALLFDRPWNREEIPSGIHRMHSWQEIVDWIKMNA
ncbi:hypothetical protein A2837_02515 [Candidatus Kaiserbacteria bacterium RIFCSPHIGHO2_01_FULL_46_22]|uniref:Nucleotidase n=1 Tax=Candidatus Kaiserbacteria bacterium RIFCSPHIGHO2_01_FULL_46_22 TaxID=1798475 RepID=A0A1F6BXX4_9BACT|nr:MAG: hypothetical protein A2837_02515 [Candidatus Kaiserbacteria bacterium RIFCSPHIGHO2_01_FULL_46_22]